MPLLELTHSAELELTAARVLMTGEPNEITIMRFMSGNEQYLQVFAVPLKTGPLETGNGVVMAIGDISRLVKLEKIRKDFAANVSHELRTPIQVIKGFTENIIASSLEDKNEIKYFAGIISKNVLMMENITNDLLTLVSLEDENDTRKVMEETNLASVMYEAAEMLEPAARKKNISIEVSCQNDITAQLHPSLFVQAIVNLLENAIKYSSEKSQVRLSVSRNNKEIIVEVEDRGIGIPVEHIGRIFERFYRVDRSRNREGGSGLGLSIVRHIVRLHNGTVEVKSHAGEGSVFRLSFPCNTKRLIDLKASNLF
jgi:two-component system phosphate regulon sensor histidine kinase PhoR